MVPDERPSLPDDLREWVDERAAETGTPRQEVIARAIAIYRLAVADDELDDVEELPDRLADVEGRVDALESDLDEKIDDVRTRVVQVKREADEKAPADHDHENLREGIERAVREVGHVRSRLSDLDDRVDAGFDNYESVLTYLDETTADLDEKLRTVAGSLLDLRVRAADLEAADLERTALSDLLRVANREGEHKATCEGCGTTVSLDLLTEPRCPACRSPFAELSPSRGFFGSATLHTGTPPALEAADRLDDVDEVDDLLDGASATSDEAAEESDHAETGEPSESAADRGTEAMHGEGRRG